MALIEIVCEAWGFTGLVPERILAINAFGNLLVEDQAGHVWRICPEELSCDPVASSPQEGDRSYQVLPGLDDGETRRYCNGRTGRSERREVLLPKDTGPARR